MTRAATAAEHADHNRDLRKHDFELNLYDVHDTSRPSPIERVRTESSFVARKAYAERHGCELTDCVAIRVRDHA